MYGAGSGGRVGGAQQEGVQLYGAGKSVDQVSALCLSKNLFINVDVRERTER